MENKESKSRQRNDFHFIFSLFCGQIFQMSLAGGLMRTLDPNASVSISDRFFLGGPLTLRGFNLKGCGPHSHGMYIKIGWVVSTL